MFLSDFVLIKHSDSEFCLYLKKKLLFMSLSLSMSSSQYILESGSEF